MDGLLDHVQLQWRLGGMPERSRHEIGKIVGENLAYLHGYILSNRGQNSEKYLVKIVKNVNFP